MPERACVSRRCDYNTKRIDLPKTLLGNAVPSHGQIVARRRARRTARLARIGARVWAGMKREELSELHYITPMANVASILRLGILSHRGAAKLPHESVAMDEIQDRRARVVVPGGRRLHDYVNLYICARNPMLYKRQLRHLDLCVVQVSTDVLDLPDVVVTNKNASSDYVRFAAAPWGLSIVDREATFAEYWTDPNPSVQWQKKSAKCAEVLVPDRVAPEFIAGVYLSCEQALKRFDDMGVGIVGTVMPHMFFL